METITKLNKVNKNIEKKQFELYFKGRYSQSLNNVRHCHELLTDGMFQGFMHIGTLAECEVSQSIEHDNLLNLLNEKIQKLNRNEGFKILDGQWEIREHIIKLQYDKNLKDYTETIEENHSVIDEYSKSHLVLSGSVNLKTAN
jgi:hypothetical protein